MDNILGCGCGTRNGTRNVKDLVAEETSSLINTSNDETTDHVVMKRNSELPEELFVEILSKLPVKSIIRFKLVCKPWKRLIESPVFIDIHLHRRNPQRGVIRWCNLEPNQYLSQENPAYNNIRSSHPILKGVFIGASKCIICVKPSLPKKRLLMYNPSIKEYSFIPDELDGMLFFVFCYLSVTQTYQIISFSAQRNNNNVDMVILTLGKTKSSRDIKDVNVPGRITCCNGATAGATTIWLGTDDCKNEIVICYDAIEERFSKMNMPSSSYSSSSSLSNCHDSLVMFVYPKAIATFFDIWILKGKKWRKYRRVGPLERNIIMKPIYVADYGRWILCLKETIGNEYLSSNLFYYDLQTDQVEYHNVNDPPTLEVINYVESLVSIKSLGLDCEFISSKKDYPNLMLMILLAILFYCIYSFGN